MGMSDYRAPALWNNKGERTPDDQVTGWLREAVAEGEAFLKSQRAFEDIDLAADIIAGPGNSERLPKTLSRVHVNRLKRQIREMVATQSNLRPTWAYKTDNKDLEDQVVVLNKLVQAWWLGTFADRSVREALQYANALGTGYVSPVWEKDFWCFGRGDIVLETYGPKDVLPIQLPKSKDLQKAYAVIIRTEAPISMAHAMYPTYADKIKPDRSQPNLWRRITKRAQRFLSPALNLRDQDPDATISYPCVDIYNVYIMDLSVNMTGRTIPMGDPGTYWDYLVPSVGQDIATGTFDAAGNPLFRKANAEDAMMYPLRRLLTVVGSKSMVRVKDGSSPWWHGKVPLVKFTVDEWPWEFLGFSPVRDGQSIQNSITRLQRVIDDSANAKLRPPMGYDESQLAKTLADAIDTRQPNQRVALNKALGEAFWPLLPADYYNVDSWIWNHIGVLKEDLDHVLAARDMTALARARQLPSGDTIEKLFEALGPIPQDMSRSMERPLRDLGDMVKCLMFEYYTTPRKVQILGTNGIVDEDYDYDPGNMIPARNAAEAHVDYLARARRHCNNFYFQVTPLSLHSMTQMSRQLMLLQWQKAGNPIDPWTMAEAFDIPNFGPPPEGTKNVIERFIAWTRMKAEIMTEVQVETQQAMQGAQMQSRLQNAAAQVIEGSNPPGRPPAHTGAPRVEQKEGGARSTVATS
jgi:hypothetical protein